MRLTHLLNGLEIQNELQKEAERLTIEGLADNSAHISDNYIFVAIKGHRSDGHDYIQDALNKGACVVIGEQEFSNLPVPYLQVENSRKALGILARNFYKNPSHKKQMIGITGTNGKTTTSYLLRHILEYAGYSCAVFGTIQNIINGESRKSTNTTPNSLDLHRMLAESKDDIAIVEVSSHGLSQWRLEGVLFDLCLFTNLHPEHLDYHHTMDRYFEAKMSLFDHMKIHGNAIINTDNGWGSKLATILKQREKNVYTTGKTDNNDLKIMEYDMETSTVIVKEFAETSIISPIAGVHNVYNTISAYAAALLAGVKKEVAAASLPHFKGIDGRFETISIPEGPTVVIDYAHTADAIENCLKTARQYSANRVLHVFGFRGNRDISKRGQMLQISASLSDQYILTLDDLNKVSYRDMIGTLKELQEEFGQQNGRIIADRTLAIKQAIKKCCSGDWVIITGKGHERYQQSYDMHTASDKETVCQIRDQSGGENLGIAF
ncbi:UDP-N-acetylmuramoyl-L-alanyl-D-glutamate--2,6-diaminopimelate ligase [Virgibacillus xinjiangensis]|uniref:UDP-N-acetylmuramyl-tripeptide synthetase n=1 Tax=Virgibacillus xinjiangensis TaxID=393090 RepID=A0ABV7CWC7_9BACI